MIVNGVVYCDTCWTTRPDLVSGCPCTSEGIKKRCDDCPASGPCASCYPERQAAWATYVKAIDGILEGLKPEYEEEEVDTLELYGAWSCENCFVSYKTYSSERAPCSYCSAAYREDWNRTVLCTAENEAMAMERYGALGCKVCKTFYSAQSPSVCSACHPQYIQDCRRQMGDYDEEDYYERMERRYGTIY